MRILIKSGAYADEKARGGHTALHKAASNGHEAVVQVLVDEGADVNAKDDGGRTALHHASLNGHEAIVLLLTPLTSDS